MRPPVVNPSPTARHGAVPADDATAGAGDRSRPPEAAAGPRSPFRLDDDTDYRRWRDWKLAGHRPTRRR